jgi:hypothetical protein
VDFFRELFLARDPELAAGPFTEVDQLASLAAERAVKIAGVLDFFFAGRTFHIRVICG